MRAVDKPARHMRAVDKPARHMRAVELLRHALQPYPGRVAALGALVLASTTLQVGAPLAIREVVDRATHGDQASALVFAGAVVAAGLLAQASGLAEVWVATDLGQRTTNDVRTRLLRLVLRLDPEFHAANPPGALVERVDGDTAQLTGLFSRVVVEAVHAALVLLGALAMAWTIAPSVAVGMAITIGLMGAALRLVVAAGHIHRVSRSAASADLFGVVEERLAGIEDVRVSGTVALASWQVEAAARRWLQRSFGAMAWNAGSGATVAVASGALTAVAFAGSGMAAVRGEASVGDVVALLVYVEVVRRPVEQLARQAREVGNAVAGAARVGALLAMEEPSISREAPSTTVSLEDAPSMHTAPLRTGGIAVEFVGVGVRYPGAERSALSDVSLVIPPGAFVGVVGRTGSGKSTLGRVLVRAIAPSAGEVRLDGIDLARHDLLDEHTLRARVAVVGQEPTVFHASIRENVTLFDATVSDDAVLAAIGRVGLADWLATQPAGLYTRLAPSGGRASGDVDGPRDGAGAQYGGLSAGEAQLLGLARAFVRDAGLVVLDEPAARVDPTTEVQLVEALRELARGRTVVVVAHRAPTIIAATHVLHIDDGRVVGFGPAEDGSSLGIARENAPAPEVPTAIDRNASSSQRATLAQDQAERVHPLQGLIETADNTSGGEQIANDRLGRDTREPRTLAPNHSRRLTPQSRGNAGVQVARDRDPPSRHGDTIGKARTTAEVARAVWAIVRGFPAWWVAAITLAGMVGYALTLGSGVIQRGFVDAVASGAVNPWSWAAVAAGFGVVRAVHFLASVTVEPWVQSRSAATVTVNAVMGALRTRTWPPLPVSPGDAVGRLRDDAAVIGRFTTYLGDPVGQVILGGSAWWLLASDDPWLAIGAFAPIAILGAIAQAASPMVSRARRAAAESVASVTDLLADAFTHAVPVRLAGASERVVAAVAERGEVRRRAAMREALVAQGFSAAWRHVGTVASGMILLASVRGLATGSVTAGDAALGVALTQSLTFLGEVYGELIVLARGSAVAFGRIGALTPGRPLALLGERRALGLLGADSPPPMRPQSSAGDSLSELSVRNLSYRFAGTGGGIEGATFTLRAGTLVAVTGPAGGGKSTLVRALVGLVPATGEVRWNGVLVDDLGDWMVAPRVACTPQSPRLFGGSVRANILGVTDGASMTTGDGSQHEGEQARLDRAIWLAGLDADLSAGLLSLETRVGPRGLRLSGGQQQRVAAARMFATGAGVVIVDDVSSALDEATEALVWDRVLESSANPLTVIAVTNRPSVIARASMVIAVDGGRCRVVHDGVRR
jgi:ATP-binding cassette subfamily B protein